MGMKMAPALATIFIGDLEETFFQEHAKKPFLWVRYIDDIFAIWTYPLNDFYEFLDTLNKAKPNIHFTAQVSTESIDFLDLTVYKPP